MVHWKDSYKFGKAEERKILPDVSKYFGRDIKEYEEQYSKHDFYCDEYNYEVKSRTNTYAKYPTTMITMDKLIDGEKKLILIFNFTDGIYWIEYNKEQFSNYFHQPFSRAGYKWDEKEHIYIPIKDLTKLERLD